MVLPWALSFTRSLRSHRRLTARRGRAAPAMSVAAMEPSDRLAMLGA